MEETGGKRLGLGRKERDIIIGENSLSPPTQTHVKQPSFVSGAVKRKRGAKKGEFILLDRGGGGEGSRGRVSIRAVWKEEEE